MPGTIHPRSGRVINAYNTPFNGRRLKHDLEERLGREVRFANDANCFALSEALDGAGAGRGVVFGRDPRHRRRWRHRRGWNGP
jgi:fructokinase